MSDYKWLTGRDISCWDAFCKMHLLKEVSRTVFYGSVFSDILDGSHYPQLMITIGRILTDILQVPDSNKIW